MARLACPMGRLKGDLLHIKNLSMRSLISLNSPQNKTGGCSSAGISYIILLEDKFALSEFLKKIVVVPTNKWPHWNFELLHYFDIGPIFSNIYDRSQAIEVHFFSFSSPYYFSQFLNSSYFQGIFSLLSISCETCVSFDWNVTLSCIHISVYVF